MSEQQLGHRPASDDDLDQVVCFVRNADELFYAFPRAHWPLTRAQLAAACAERQGSTLALLDGQPAGFANFYQSVAGEYCALGNLMIAPWARSQGVASYLVGVMEQLALRDFDARELKVSCFNDNAAGLLLYARLGYRLAGLEERQRGEQRVALLQFVKSLRS
ncbi:MULTISPECIES: GNAT family N-acetyltransferase [unclassified Pseudomonas]|uniref:GNAT family N-acetyltransferase n=1 Tax=unclassified Pseudomonas TaxID=196821 RepID=UPI0024496D24|nr:MULTISPECIES: GNAT family N-acetyltransferase [unclassified Pseudomonas]MDG9924577.1 GNAT family N-acetyltransferase [Pseudomonas sp. GD04045]MDH0033550.1 GNAT family N-acetyltransferase [Pseudomonas sp. GD04019]